MNMPSVLVVGPSAIGKTVAVAQALNPDHSFWICTEPGALEPMFNLELNPWKKIPPMAECLSTHKPASEVQRWVQYCLDEHAKGRIKAVVLDTLSTLCEREWAYIRNSLRVDEGYGRANRALGLSINPLIYDLLSVRSLLVCMICHEKESSTIEGKFMPGGPKLPGDLIKTVPAQFDICIRVGVEAGQRIMKVDPLDRTFLTKDRYSVITDGEKLDLRSVLKRVLDRKRAFTNGLTASQTLTPVSDGKELGK